MDLMIISLQLILKRAVAVFTYWLEKVGAFEQLSTQLYFKTKGFGNRSLLFK
jgi:hypothetical protein